MRAELTREISKCKELSDCTRSLENHRQYSFAADCNVAFPPSERASRHRPMHLYQKTVHVALTRLSHITSTRLCRTVDGWSTPGLASEAGARPKWLDKIRLDVGCCRSWYARADRRFRLSWYSLKRPPLVCLRHPTPLQQGGYCEVTVSDPSNSISFVFGTRFPPP